MKTLISQTAIGLFALMVASTSNAHDPDQMQTQFPVTKKEAPMPTTCSELKATDKSKLNQKDPNIQALEKRCKAETEKKSKDDTVK